MAAGRGMYSAYDTVNKIISSLSMVTTLMKRCSSDIKWNLLKNALQASTVLRRFSTLITACAREFFDTINIILKARDAKFVLPIKELAPYKYVSQIHHDRSVLNQLLIVHHGFDFYTSEWTPVQAIEDGTIIHVKRDFSWNEMNHLHTGDSELEEQENLDVYP